MTLVDGTVAPKRWELYRLLSEPVRLRLLALAADEELGVGELADLLGEGQPNVSRHVAALRTAGLVAVRREGQKALVGLTDAARADAVVMDALAAGRRVAQADGSLARVAEIVRARDAAARAFFAAPRGGDADTTFPPELPAYLGALAPLVPNRALAVDVGTGDGGLLDVLAPVFDRVIAVDRSEAQLARARRRVARRGYDNVELVAASWDDDAVAKKIGARGADAVFVSRVLHHAPRPAAALAAWARLVAAGGALVVIDYAPHEDERMRDEQADLWLGLSREDLARWARKAGLADARVTPLPTVRSGDSPDRHLTWHALVARRPSEPSKKRES